MGYQALLFCPDEKTARTVTQVLSELDFSVVPCTEPFGAVKKLMSEHFDAVVVDCDNEQNATLLFKSARNSPNNHSSLAVAVVEGQAGVAKAFRIGANLVLTKPVNVEQAKGTLRVARGLLRKSEASKSTAGAAGAVVKPVTAPTLTLQRATPTAPAASPAASIASSAVAAATAMPIQKSVEQTRVVASVPSEIKETDIEETNVEILDEENDVIASASAVAPEAKAAGSNPEVQSSSVQRPLSSGGFGASSASAPAPARESKSSATETKTPSVSAEPKSAVEKVVARESIAIAEMSAPAASLAVPFGNTLEQSTKPAGGGGSKMLLAVAAVVLVAGGGYEAWMLWGRGNATVPAHIATQPTTTAAPATTAQKVAKVAPSVPAPVAAPTVASPDTSSTPEAVESVAPTKKVVETEEPAAKAAAKPIAIKSGGAKSTAAVDAPAPNMVAIAATGNSAALPSLMVSGKAPAPVLQNLNVSQGVSRGLLVKEVPPAYPASALHMRVDGEVELLATITKNGDISAVKVLSGDPQLSHAAAEAVKKWKYKPYLLNGEPVEIQTQVTVKFKLPQ
jgi:periplasmic protein TonB